MTTPPPFRSARPVRALAVAMLLAAPALAGPTTAPKPHDTSAFRTIRLT